MKNKLVLALNISLGQQGEKKKKKNKKELLLFQKLQLFSGRSDFSAALFMQFL